MLCEIVTIFYYSASKILYDIYKRYICIVTTMHLTSNGHFRIVIINAHFWLLIVAVDFSYLRAVVGVILAFLSQSTQCFY